MNEHQQIQLDKNFSQLLAISSHTFSPDEINEVSHYIHTGEYDMALDIYVAICDEEHKHIDPQIAKTVLSLVDMMHLNGPHYEGKINTVLSMPDTLRMDTLKLSG